VSLSLMVHRGYELVSTRSQPRKVVAVTSQTSLTFAIGQVSEQTGLSPYTLRFYEDEGLFLAPVRRDMAGRRMYTEQDVEWLRVGTRLRSSGMPLPEIRRYVQLVKQGAGNEAARFEILRRHEARVQQKVNDLHEALDIIHTKVELYAQHLSAGTADQLWTSGPECDRGDVTDPGVREARGIRS